MLVSALALLALAPAARAAWPADKPVRIIIPNTTGGPSDIMARLLAPLLGEALGGSFVAENIGGGGGNIGTARAARAEPDGYTLLFSVESTMAIAKLVQPSTVQYDSQKDFQPISLIGTSPLVLAGKKTLPAESIADLMKLLRANPGKLSYATSGVGTSLQLAGEMINAAGGVQMQHVPYRVGAQMVTDLVGNHVDLAVLPLVMALPAYRSGAIKIFGITEPVRSPLAPDLPSLAEESTLKSVEVTVWFGLFAPAKVDGAIVARLHRAVADSLAEPEVRAKLTETSLRIVGSTPAEFAAFLAKEIEKFAVIVKTANIKAE